MMDGLEWFLSARSVWSATLDVAPEEALQAGSIRALRVERDLGCLGYASHPPLFLSARSVWSATSEIGPVHLHVQLFLSARSVWSATSPLRRQLPCACFYPRAPCGARRSSTLPKAPGQRFYPRAPCGARRVGENVGRSYNGFLSARSVWSAT